MVGRLKSDQGQLFYEFRLGDAVPEDHLIGGGFGRVFKVGDQPVNASIAGCYNAIRPTGSPAWQLRASVALLFPVK